MSGGFVSGSAESTVRRQAQPQDAVCFLSVQHSGFLRCAAERRAVLFFSRHDTRLFAESLQLVLEQKVVQRKVACVRTALHVALRLAVLTTEKLHFLAGVKYLHRQPK